LKPFGFIRCIFRPCVWLEHSRRSDYFSGDRYVTWMCRHCHAVSEVRAGTFCQETGVDMQQFRVILSARASVSAMVEVTASTEAEAHKVAVKYAHEGNALWTYEECQDGTIEVESVSKA
jgi:hypothetical protein